MSRQPSAQPETPSVAGGIRYRRYLLLMLMLLLAFNYADRIAIGIVLDDIKHDLHLTDTELGLLTGIAFALFYSIMGIQIARWADRGNRIRIISITAIFWSFAVAACGLVTNFYQMLAARVLVAVGEAGGVPPAHSLLADSFTQAERPRAMSIYMLGGPLALTAGFFAAGWLNQWLGWRAMFAVIGLPGVLLGLIAWLTLREPRARQPIAAGASSSQSLLEVLVLLWSLGAFRHLLICYAVWAFFGWGILQWQPAFFIRSHGFTTGELGTWLALIHGLCGGIGVYVGGELATRYAASREYLQLRYCAYSFLIFAVLNAVAYIAPNAYLAFGLLAAAALGGNMIQGPFYAAVQTLVPAHLRAQSIAIMTFFAQLVGLGLGPLAVGMMSDVMRPTLGAESLRWALVLLCPGYFWAAWHLWRASQLIEPDESGPTGRAIEAKDKVIV